MDGFEERYGRNRSINDVELIFRHKVSRGGMVAPIGRVGIIDMDIDLDMLRSQESRSRVQCLDGIAYLNLTFPLGTSASLNADAWRLRGSASSSLSLINASSSNSSASLARLRARSATFVEPFMPCFARGSSSP